MLLQPVPTQAAWPLFCSRSCCSRTGIQIFSAEFKQHCFGQCCQYVFFLAGTIGRLGLEPCLIYGSSDIGFLTLCMAGLKCFVKSSGLLIFRLWRSRLTWSKVQEVKAKLRHHFVLYNEDHHPNHIVCYCPQFYMRSILTTWDDPATFESLQGSPTTGAPGMQSMPQLWRSLHRHWSNPSTEPDQEWNDDLVGFFNAVLRQDIICAVTVLTEQFLEPSGCTVLLVDLLSKSGHQGRGTTCSSFKRCWVGDIPWIVQVCFSTGMFTAAGKCRLQTEGIGICIGNQISPVLSGIPVFMAEQIFLKSLPHAVFSSLSFLRYVGSRLILAPSRSRIFQNPQIRNFCLPVFYGGIQLESVNAHQWLGFTIDAPARTATFNLPKKPWQIRSPASAGSWRLAASGFFSRAALVRQYAWPKESALPQIRALQEIYVQAGFPKGSVPEPRADSKDSTVFTVCISITLMR